jgi:hypothetical protein
VSQFENLGSELDPLWLSRVSKLTAKGWKNFVARDKDRIKELRARIHMLATEGQYHSRWRFAALLPR